MIEVDGLGWIEFSFGAVTKEIGMKSGMPRELDDNQQKEKETSEMLLTQPAIVEKLKCNGESERERKRMSCGVLNE